MDSGIAAILGALIGAISSPLVAWASEHFKHPVTRKSDKLPKTTGEDSLIGDKKWRPIEYLSAAVGADEERTKRLLLEIDARQSLSKGRDNWALVARAPFPDEAAEDDTDSAN